MFLAERSAAHARGELAVGDVVNAWHAKAGAWQTGLVGHTEADGTYEVPRVEPV